MALTRVLEGAEDVKLFGRETFYPLDYWQIPFSVAEQGSTGEGYAIHHWHATWQTRENLMRRTRELMLRSRERRQRDQNRLRRQQRRLDRKDQRLKAALARERKVRDASRAH